MLGIIQRTTFGLLVLLIMPAAVWLTGWSWQPGSDERMLKNFFIVTQTVSAPWGYLVSLLLACWFIKCLRLRFNASLSLFLLLLATIGIGQQLNKAIKSTVKEPRPFMVWLEQQYHLPANEFHSLPTAKRARLLNDKLASETRVPHWLQANWQRQNDFSFPSGHAMFSASWVLLAFALLLPCGSYVSVVVITLWGIAVMGSRLLLGMHWPWDLMAAAAISWVLVNIVGFFILAWGGPSKRKTARSE